jgi:phospholipid N-methyltransferase
MTKSGTFIFLREFLTKPKFMGAALPSSKKLAQVTVDFLPQHVDGLVIELGAGTGVITEALLDKVDHSKIRVIERSSDLCNHLKKRFKDIAIINGDAKDLSNILRHEKQKVAAVISGLPLRSLPKDLVKTIEQEIKNVLAPNGLYIQFTYQLIHNVEYPHFVHVAKKYIWKNAPPARVDCYQLKSF